MKRLFTILLIQIIFLNAFVPSYAFAEAVPDDKVLETEENPKFKGKKITPKTPKQPVQTGNPWFNLLGTLALLTPVGAELYESTMEQIEAIDMYLWEKQQEYAPLLKEGILYTGEELTNWLNNLIRNYTRDEYELQLSEDMLTYPMIWSYLRSIWINSSARETYVIKPGRKEVAESTIAFYTRHNGDYVAEMRIVFAPWGSTYKYNSVLVRLVHESGRFVDFFAVGGVSNDIQEIFNLQPETDEEARNFFLQHEMSLRQASNIWIYQPGYKIPVEIPDHFPYIPGSIVPDTSQIVEIDGELFRQFEVANPWYNPNIESSPERNPKTLPFVVPIRIPTTEPIPAPEPIRIPINVPDLAPEPAPEPGPAPGPSPGPAPGPAPGPSPGPGPSPSPPGVPSAPEGEFSEGKGCRELDMELKSIDLFTTKFPFSIPFDIYRALEAFFGKMGSEEPRFVLSFISDNVVLEIPDFIKDWVPLIRTLILFMFDISIIYALYRWFGGAS